LMSPSMALHLKLKLVNFVTPPNPIRLGDGVLVFPSAKAETWAQTQHGPRRLIQVMILKNLPVNMLVAKDALEVLQLLPPNWPNHFPSNLQPSKQDLSERESIDHAMFMLATDKGRNGRNKEKVRSVGRDRARDRRHGTERRRTEEWVEEEEPEPDSPSDSGDSDSENSDDSEGDGSTSGRADKKYKDKNMFSLADSFFTADHDINLVPGFADGKLPKNIRDVLQRFEPVFVKTLTASKHT